MSELDLDFEGLLDDVDLGPGEPSAAVVTATTPDLRRPIEKVLAVAQGAEVKPDGSYMCLCPAHDDNTPSLHITEDQSGKLLINCFKGCKLPSICYAWGMTVSELFPWVESRGGSRAANKKFGKPKGKPTATYDYHDADGVLVYQAVRYESDDGKKTFTQRRPDGKGGWIYKMTGVPRVLFGLPELIAADKSKVVFVVEGEKKVEALRKWGYVTVCNVGGAGKWLTAYGTYFRGRNVIILPDHDPIDEKTGACPGYDHAVKVKKSIEGTAKSFLILVLPGLPSKGDIVDWQADGHTKEEFQSIVDNPQVYEWKGFENEPRPAAAGEVHQKALDPASTDYEELLCRDLGIEVQGEIDGAPGRIKVFSRFSKRTYPVEIEKFKYATALQICGPVAKFKITTGDDPAPGVHTLGDVKNSIALLGGMHRVGPGNERGAGVFTGIGKDSSKIVVVRTGEAVTYSEEAGLGSAEGCHAYGLTLDMGTPYAWFKTDELKSNIERAAIRSFCLKAIDQTEELFGRLCWRNQHDTPLVVTAAVMAAMIQSTMEWRPHMAVIGQSNTGKSSFAGMLEELSNGLICRSSNSSAAGISQTIGTASPLVLVDEFEESKYRTGVLEMFRSASRGDMSLKGTASHRAKSFNHRFIGWILSTESGLQLEQDVNRYIIAELVLPPDHLRGQLIVPPNEELSELGKKLLAISIRHAIPARELAGKLKRTQFDGLHQRIIENFAPLAAIVAAAQGYDFGEAKGLLCQMLQIVPRDEVVIPNHDLLLADILASVVDTGYGERLSVAQCIDKCVKFFDLKAARESKYGTSLERSGVFVLEDGIFIAHTVVPRLLLSGTKWEHQNILDHLKRVDRAVKDKGRPVSSGSRLRGVWIPASHPELENLFYETEETSQSANGFQ